MAIGYQIVVPYLRNEERPYLDAGVNAFDGDKRVGYIRAEWISSALIDQTLPTVWHYAHEFEGISVGISAESDLSDYQTLLHLWRRAYSYEAWGFRPPSQRNKGLSPGSSLREHHPSAMEIVSDLDALARYRGYDVAFEKFKPTYVIHLAARVGGLYKNMNERIKMLEENISINTNVIKCCDK